MKYMLLIFEPDLLPIDEYVMTTEGHPLSVEPLRCGAEQLCRDEYTEAAACNCAWDALVLLCGGCCGAGVCRQSRWCKRKRRVCLRRCGLAK